MATNKNALLRYRVLDKCFRNPGKRYFIEDLISECEKVLLESSDNSNGISRRQILQDINFMESNAGWQIELLRQRVGKRVFYRYANPSFSINNMPLNEIEINQLRTAANILGQFIGMPQFEWLHGLLPKLQHGMTTKGNPNPIIEFDNNPYLKGIEYLGELHNAIFYEKVLRIRYHPYDVKLPFDLIIHPYFLKQYNNRWFLFGYNQENNKDDWNLAIDRIVSIKEVDDRYRKNTIINWLEYFDDIIGVTKPENFIVEEVRLLFFGMTGKYIETKPLHGSQKNRWISEKILEVTLRLMINYEFERLILSYADSVKVASPEKLIQKINTRLSKALSSY